MIRTARRFSLIALCIAPLLSGCALGPNYQRPPLNSPAAFRNAPTTQPAATAPASLADLPWWEVFKDPALADLTHEALANGYDLRIAISRVERARAIAAQSQAELFPQLGYSGVISRGRNSFFGSAFPNGGVTESGALATLNAAWEIDLWGRIRRADEAALAQLMATEEARRGVMLSLVSEVAQDYLELLGLDLELTVARRNATSFTESLSIFRQRAQGGVGSNLQVLRAEAALANTAATIPELERQIQLKENQISVLLGRNSGPVSRSAPLAQLALPPDVPVGLPSDLLERRPDVRQAEENLKAANARVGVTVANFFPRLGLTALLGQVSPELSDFSSSRNNAWAIGADVSGPIFQGGRLRAQHDQAIAELEQARLTYKQTALAAFGDVADALIARQKLDEVRVQLAQSVQSLGEAVNVARQLYGAGRASYFEVLEAQQQLFPAEVALARTRTRQFVVIVQLYRALGGGWNLKDEQWDKGR